MNRRQFEMAVALATGESRREIRHRGFRLAAPRQLDQEPLFEDRPPMIVDWDAVDACRPGLFP